MTLIASIEAHGIKEQVFYNFAIVSSGISYLKLSFSVFCRADELNSLQIESVWVKITEAGQIDFVVVGVCYRSQTATEKEIYDMFRAISIASKYQTLIMGNYNYQGLIW